MARPILLDVGMADFAAFGQQGIKSVPSRSTRKRKARAKLAARVRDERFKAGPFWFKMLISEATAGVIMGHGGSTLIGLEKETLAAIKLSPYGSYFANSNLRVLVIAAPSLEALKTVVMKLVCDYILADIAVESVYVCLGSPASMELARGVDASLASDEPVLQHEGETVMEVSVVKHGGDRRLTSLTCASIALAVQNDRSHLANTVRLVYDPLALLPGDIDGLVDAHFCNIVFECSNVLPPALFAWLSKNCHVEIDIQSGENNCRLARIEDMPLDHFSLAGGDQATFPVHYWLSTKYYDSAKDHCVIYYIMGGESPLPESGVAYPFISERLAEANNGLVIESEHRLYGSSVPPKYEESLPYLSVEQSLMDHATILQNTLETVEGAKRCRAVAIGGSYSGFLALAFRLRYPKLVYAAYASSSPGRFYSQEAPYDGGYYSLLTDAADRIRPNCSASVIRAFDDLRNRYGDRVTFEQAKDELSICNPEAFGSEDDVLEELLQMVRIEFSGANMASYPPDSNSSTYKLCTTVEQSGIQGVFKAMAKGDTCLDVTRHLPSPDKNGVYSASCGDWTGCGIRQAGRSWDWQTCTQLVERISTYGPPSDMFPPRKFSVDRWLNAHCKKSFGSRAFRNFSDSTREHRLNDFWGFDEATLPKITSRVLFVNGGTDGWTAGAVTSNLSETIVAIMIPSGAHHSEMKAPSNHDTPDMVAARDQIEAILDLWLGATDAQEAEEAEAYEVMI
ncbi:hypothetical protein FOZ60_010461 [Perkinsus olseni]|uniref:Thymus-specific serine protease n=1 Tax=Perkinsus olseni TaxID=32597 RepID=A0A7J6NF18_PEROL|nr:hypothetical protein FOZ60_010461 [Perkinsus olseni]